MDYWIYTVQLGHFHRYKDVRELVVRRIGILESAFGLCEIDAKALLRVDKAGDLTNIG